jgi:hypothetical protein
VPSVFRDLSTLENLSFFFSGLTLAGQAVISLEPLHRPVFVHLCLAYFTGHSVSSGFIHIVAYVRISFLFKAEYFSVLPAFG